MITRSPGYQKAYDDENDIMDTRKILAYDVKSSRRFCIAHSTASAKAARQRYNNGNEQDHSNRRTSNRRATPIESASTDKEKKDEKD